MLRESLSIILTLLIAGVLIGGIDFVRRNLDDTLDDSSNQLANGPASVHATKPATDFKTGGGGQPGPAADFATHQPEGPSRLPLGGGF